jgi:hypothetical protein
LPASGLSCEKRPEQKALSAKFFRQEPFAPLTLRNGLGFAIFSEELLKHA